MAARGNDRPPQFTETHYEIPAWQVPWNKPWYQWDKKENDADKTVRDAQKQQYSNRGHLIDCNCKDCEDDLETAFAPQFNNTSLEIPEDRPNIDVDEFDNLSRASFSKCQDVASDGVDEHKPQPCSSDRGPKAPKENIILLSDLPEYVPPTSNNEVVSSDITHSTSTITHPASSVSHGGGPDRHESLMSTFDNLTAIQRLSDQTRDIQTRVNNFKGTRESRDYVVMRDLLLSLQRELGRVNHNGFEWLHRARNMALEAVTRTLVVLEQKVKENE
ncbi:predicted protein [Nematostella vectensis]|uniref:BAG domain-containing protein n=1 Tax=Nematostella vectensis TaxID=45351 RepID=A7SC39_NEMVE|nr:uncharacterized protein LOC5510362 [Nematostella vectensis]EDO38768.1 predicted protein [Nematostella vectensis]|eukprot:XP_001630831.1 predicted protein [Nematostella vectensis]